MGRPRRQKGRKRPPKRTPNRPQNNQKTTPKSIKFQDDLFGAIRGIGLRMRGIGGSSLGRPSPPGTCPGTPFRAFKESKKYYNTTILQYCRESTRDQGTQGPKGPKDPRTQGTKGSKGPKGPKDQRTQRKKLEKIMSIICHALGLTARRI